MHNSTLHQTKEDSIQFVEEVQSLLPLDYLEENEDFINSDSYKNLIHDFWSEQRDAEEVAQIILNGNKLLKYGLNLCENDLDRLKRVFDIVKKKYKINPYNESDIIAIEILISQEYELSIFEITKKKTRKEKYIEPRHLLFYFLRHNLRKTYHNIADRYGYNHTTVLHAIKSVQNRVETESIYRFRFNEIQDKIKQMLAK